MVATTLHIIAVSNLFPARVKVVFVDINPSTVIKPADRGSFQTVGLVTDVEPFFRALVYEVLTGNMDDIRSDSSEGTSEHFFNEASVVIAERIAPQEFVAFRRYYNNRR